LAYALDDGCDTATATVVDIIWDWWLLVDAGLDVFAGFCWRCGCLERRVLEAQTMARAELQFEGFDAPAGGV
jgi:hypothetical protein